MAGSGSNTLRAVLKELGWSRTRLVAELRRQAAGTGDTLPGTESLIAMVSRWVNNHQQPNDFYRDLLARTLGWSRAELFRDEAARLELAAEAEPWLLARALEASSVGQAALEALEEAVGEFARSYPSTAPIVLARPVLEHFRDVARLLDSPLPVARRQRLAVVAGTWPGWPAVWRSTCATRARPWPTSRWPFKPPTMPTHPTWPHGRWPPGA